MTHSHNVDIMRAVRFHKPIWLLFLVLVCVLLMKEYTLIMDNYMNFKRLSTLALKVSTSTTITSTTLQTTTTFPVFRKNLYMKFNGRFGNAIFEFAGAYSMTLAAGCQKLYFTDKGQSQRLTNFFPKIKNLVNIVGSIPQGLTQVKELNFNMYDPKTTREVAESKTDVFLYEFLGEF